MELRLVQIPRHLLHVGLDDLPGLGVSHEARDALRALLADLPAVPDTSVCAQLVGPAQVTLPCLAVVARHVGQGLRDHNLAMAHDRARLHEARRKLLFLDTRSLVEAVASGDRRPEREAVLCVSEATPAVCDLLRAREAAGLASFLTSTAPMPCLAHWREINLRG